MAAKIMKFDSTEDELVAKYGSFDISGTDPVVDKQYWSFNASDGAIIAAIKGVKVGTSVANLAAIREAEIDVSGKIVTSLVKGLAGGSVYRVPGYVITSITLGDATSLLHCYLIRNQVSA